MSLNKVMLIGRLGRDAELKTITNDQIVLKTSLAVSERYKSKDGNSTEKTTWFNLSAFGKRWEAVSQYLLKGKLVYVEGKIQYNEWSDKEGIQHRDANILVNDIVFLSNGKTEEQKPRDPSFDNAMGEIQKEVAAKFPPKKQSHESSSYYDPSADELPF